jgi:predicted ribosomally synthesized peptide with nif11-like leader
MSIADAQAFRQKVAQDTKLQQEVEQAVRKEAEAGVVRLGQRYGLQFTTDDIYAALTNSELTDFELEMVGGGAAVYNAECARERYGFASPEVGLPGGVGAPPIKPGGGTFGTF